MGRQAVQVSEVETVEMETWSPVVEGTLLADRVASHVKTKKSRQCHKTPQQLHVNKNSSLLTL